MNKVYIGAKLMFLGKTEGVGHKYTEGKIYTVLDVYADNVVLQSDDRPDGVKWYGPAVISTESGYWKSITSIQRNLPDWF